jgi:5-methyltetrahydropteroyltriglutamate--homocysteine methyltransferase
LKRSDERILTTHVGSLPRPTELVALAQAYMNNESIDQAQRESLVRSAVENIVRQQANVGLDIVDDGEMGKAGFIVYANERLAGFEPPVTSSGGSYWGNSREVRAFPGFYDWAAKQPGAAGNVGATRWVCTAPIKYVGRAALARDLDILRTALAGVSVSEAFIPSISPATIEDWNSNTYYPDRESYLYAIAEAMREEYLAIVDAGFILQVDDPELATHYVLHPEDSIDECRRTAEGHVEALNHSLRGIPRDRIRYHTCYSINMGPRVHDMELKDILDIVLRVNAGAFSFEYGNPRHEHELAIWQRAAIPPEVVLIPGVISHSTVLVEHPELIAERIAGFARIVGRERVIAGADCGFASFATSFELHPEVVWAKLRALVEGAKIASGRLW